MYKRSCRLSWKYKRHRGDDVEYCADEDDAHCCGEKYHKRIGSVVAGFEKAQDGKSAGTNPKDYQRKCEQQNNHPVYKIELGENYCCY